MFQLVWSRMARRGNIWQSVRPIPVWPFIHQTFPITAMTQPSNENLKFNIFGYFATIMMNLNSSCWILWLFQRGWRELIHDQELGALNWKNIFIGQSFWKRQSTKRNPAELNDFQERSKQFNLQPLSTNTLKIQFFNCWQVTPLYFFHYSYVLNAKHIHPKTPCTFEQQQNAGKNTG